MEMICGAILILAGEQAFAHAFLIGFPHQLYARSILLPFAAISMVLGVVFLVHGFLGARKSQ